MESKYNIYIGKRLFNRSGYLVGKIIDIVERDGEEREEGKWGEFWQVERFTDQSLTDRITIKD